MSLRQRNSNSLNSNVKTAQHLVDSAFTGIQYNQRFLKKIKVSQVKIYSEEKHQLTKKK